MTGTVPLREVMTDATRVLSDAGIESARAEVQALAVAILGLPREAMLARPDAGVPAMVRSEFDAAVARRAAREPFARIAGYREFWSLEFALGPETLVPRPETETVVEAALAIVPDRERSLSILDLGTGTGCILLALLSELPAAHGVGIDISENAVAVARDNAERLGLARRASFLAGDWGAGLAPGFDLIVSNPPYVSETDRDALAPEVRNHDPARALFAGPDGLAAYRRVAPDIARLLTPGGLAVVEIGAHQADDVTGIFRQAGLGIHMARHDLAGHIRALVFGCIALDEKSGDTKKTVGIADITV